MFDFPGVVWDYAYMTDLLEIPAFLKRDKAPQRSTPRRKRRMPKMPKLAFDKRPPKTKDFEGATKVSVRLGNQCPRIGSGFRRLWAKRGRKWVHLCDSHGFRGKLSLDEFERSTA